MSHLVTALTGAAKDRAEDDGLPNAHVRAHVLVQALPHMQRYDQEVVVVKYGGHAMGDRAAAEDFAEDIVLLEQSGGKPIVVHGGGAQVGKRLGKVGSRAEVKASRTVSDAAPGWDGGNG